METKIDKLKVNISPSRKEMGDVAAKEIAEKLKELLAGKNEVNMLFAAAPSQSEMLQTLTQIDGIAWNRVNAFHMDEYVGLSREEKQSFGSFLRENIFSKLDFKQVNYINGVADDREEECERYAQLLADHPLDIGCLGIGENCHIAFNDPHVADFNDEKDVKIVDLDLACRQQQVNDGCFSTLDNVPKFAFTLTIPSLVRAKHIFCVVPGKNKAQAVQHTFEQDIQELYPSTKLREHDSATMYIDADSASLLNIKK